MIFSVKNGNRSHSNKQLIVSFTEGNLKYLIDKGGNNRTIVMLRKNTIFVSFQYM